MSADILAEIRDLFSEHPATQCLGPEQVARALKLTGRVRVVPKTFEVEDALGALELEDRIAA